MADILHPAEKVMAKYHLERKLQLKPRMLPEDIQLTAQGDELFHKEAELSHKDPVEVVEELGKITLEQLYAHRDDMPAIVRYGRFERKENFYQVRFELHTKPLPTTIEELEHRLQGNHNWNLTIKKAGDSNGTIMGAYLEKDGEHRLLDLYFEPDNIMKLPATLIEKLYTEGMCVDAEKFTENVLRTMLPKLT